MEKILNIICVDDEKIILDSLNSQLTRNFGDKFKYEFAESALEALEIIDEIKTSDDEELYVIISDWYMPGMKGDELLTEVMKNINNVKTILLTGHIDKDSIDNLKESNKNIKFIFKPWNEKELISLIKE